MNRYRTFLTSALLASGLGFAAAPALAENQDCGHMGNHKEYSEHRMENMEKHHKKLHAALKLTPEQEGAWKKFTDAKKPMPMAESEKNDDWSKLTAPERADKMLERMKAHEKLMTDHIAALKEFYAVLTPEQKKTFDQTHSGQHDGMRGKMKYRAAESNKAVQKP